VEATTDSPFGELRRLHGKDSLSLPEILYSLRSLLFNRINQGASNISCWHFFSAESALLSADKD